MKSNFVYPRFFIDGKEYTVQEIRSLRGSPKNSARWQRLVHKLNASKVDGGMVWNFTTMTPIEAARSKLEHRNSRTHQNKTRRASRRKLQYMRWCRKNNIVYKRPVYVHWYHLVDNPPIKTMWVINY